MWSFRLVPFGAFQCLLVPQKREKADRSWPQLAVGRINKFPFIYAYFQGILTFLKQF